MAEKPDAWGERLPRSLGTFSAVAILVGSTIGSGIFRSPAKVAEDVQDPLLFVLAWVLGGVVALAGALTYSELAAMFPRSGGMYHYLKEAFGDGVAFLFGWAELVILRPAAYGAIAIISAEYLLVLFGVDGAQPFTSMFPTTRAQMVAAVMLVIVGGVNYFGVELGAVIQNVSTVLKVFALLTLVALGFALQPGELPPPETPSVADHVAEFGVVSAFGLAMVSVFWAYDGWSDVGFVSGEVKNPGRVLPIAFIAGTAIVVALYLLANAVYLAVVPLDAMPGRPLIAADVARALLGPVGVVLVSGAVMISTFGTLNGSMMTGPRVFFAMAEDGLFFRRLAAVHPVYGTPAASIVLSVVLGIAFVSVRTFGQLADQFVIGIWPFYALSVAAVLVLRARRPDAERPYRTLGYPIVPLVFLAAAVFILGNYLVREPLLTAIDVAVLCTGIPVYLWWRAQAGATSLRARDESDSRRSSPPRGDTRPQPRSRARETSERDRP